MTRTSRETPNHDSPPLVSLAEIALLVKTSPDHAASPASGPALCVCGTIIPHYVFMLALGEHQPPEAAPHAQHGGAYRIPGLGRRTQGRAFIVIARAWADWYAQRLAISPGVKREETSEAAAMRRDPASVDARMAHDTSGVGEWFESWVNTAAVSVAERWLAHLARYAGVTFTVAPSAASLDALATLAILDIPGVLGDATPEIPETLAQTDVRATSSPRHRRAKAMKAADLPALLAQGGLWS